jgi:hypothetical protein
MTERSQASVGGSDIGGTNYINPYNLRLSRAISAADVSQRFVANYVYELPFLRTHPMALVRELIRRKEKGEKLVTAEPVEESNVIDLMEALKKSLKNKGKPAPARAASSTAKRKAR